MWSGFEDKSWIPMVNLNLLPTRTSLKTRPWPCAKILVCSKFKFSVGIQLLAWKPLHNVDLAKKFIYFTTWKDRLRHQHMSEKAGYKRTDTLHVMRRLSCRARARHFLPRAPAHCRFETLGTPLGATHSCLRGQTGLSKEGPNSYKSSAKTELDIQLRNSHP